MRQLIKNVLLNRERKKLIKDCKPYLLDDEQMIERFGKNFPGKQTDAGIYKVPCFKNPIDKIRIAISNLVEKDVVLERAWINWTNGDSKEVSWHNHPSNISAVYYMTRYNCGTQFHDSFVEAEVNSLLVFSSELIHTAPDSNSRYDRYTMALDFNYE